MKKIIAGQLMMWTNLAAIVIGYVLFKATGIESEVIQVFLGVFGFVSACFNLIVAISLQTRGYKETNIIDLTR